MDNNISKVSREGDLAPKHIEKLKESHLKKKKKGGVEYLTESAHSRLTKSTTNKSHKSS